jgi:hypothetical protein
MKKTKDEDEYEYDIPIILKVDAIDLRTPESKLAELAKNNYKDGKKSPRVGYGFTNRKKNIIKVIELEQGECSWIHTTMGKNQKWPVWSENQEKGKESYIELKGKKKQDFLAEIDYPSECEKELLIEEMIEGALFEEECRKEYEKQKAILEEKKHSDKPLE